MAVRVIGGGAAGFFAAIAAAERGAHVVIHESASEVLQKVLISGGGRCNVTHDADIPKLLAGYPRGSTQLRPAFERFHAHSTREWFAKRGVPTVVEADGRVFPATNTSMTVAHCLRKAAAAAGVEVRCNSRVTSLSANPDGSFAMDVVERDPASRGTLHPAPPSTRRTSPLVIVATGPGSVPLSWARNLGHTIIPPVPSLFSLHIRDPRLEGLQGLSVSSARVWLPDLSEGANDGDITSQSPPPPSATVSSPTTPSLPPLVSPPPSRRKVSPLPSSSSTFSASLPISAIPSFPSTTTTTSSHLSQGPLLITHQGLSGPAALRLSAFAARDLHACKYQAPLMVNWTCRDLRDVVASLEDMRARHPNMRIGSNPMFGVPKRLWERLAEHCGVADMRWGDGIKNGRRERGSRKSEEVRGVRSTSLTVGKASDGVQHEDYLGSDVSGEDKDAVARMALALCECRLQVHGRSPHRDEFVTAGGVSLDNLDVLTWQSKVHKGLYFAGEVADVDGVTGGYNFQHAWTSGFLAGVHAAGVLASARGGVKS